MKQAIKFVLPLLLAAVCAGPATADDCDTVVINAIMDAYGLEAGTHEIEILSNRVGVEEVDPSSLTYREISHKEPVGLFTILATVDLGNGEVKRGQVRMRIRKYSKVLVTQGPVERHAELSQSGLLVRRMEVTNLRQRPVTTFEELAGQRTRKMIRKDEILTYDAIEAIPDVEVGTEVTIVLSESLLRITAPGRCLESGSAGEKVKVKNKATGKVLKARVIDSSSVAVDI